eukprot:COSAG04_NODE_24947_length_314_cov_0.962791_2_plen_73_part_01
MAANGAGSDEGASLIEDKGGSEQGGSAVGNGGRRVAEGPKDLRRMAQKTWLFLAITITLNIHNTIDGTPLPPC